MFLILFHLPLVAAMIGTFEASSSRSNGKRLSKWSQFEENEATLPRNALSTYLLCREVFVLLDEDLIDHCQIRGHNEGRVTLKVTLNRQKEE